MHTDTDIFCIRCAAYLCLLPRTHTQNQRAQTHSRRQAMLAPATKNVLPSSIHVLLPATTFHSLQTVPQLALPYFCTRFFFCFVIE